VREGQGAALPRSAPVGATAPASGQRRSVRLPPLAEALPARALRPEIQALRAGAVALVVLFHVWPALVPGGYVGVDVFFVISGYLITRHLLLEAEHSGTIAVLDFWARRARRLLPASFLVLGACATASFAWAPEGAWRQYFREIAASALYVQNWRLGLDAVDYFAASNAPSPVQHFWTLSVEEQFYLALPLLMLAVLGGCRLLPSLHARRGLGLAIAGAGAWSLAHSCLVTWSAPSAAYFSTPARAWEFAAGALLSFAAVTLGARPRALAAGAGWAAILVAAFAFDESTRLPGVAAGLPVLGALLVIGAGAAGRWQDARPIRWLGDHSYSIYLWHWPLLVFAPLVLKRELGHLDRAGLVALALALGAATKRWVEDPIRFSRWPLHTLGPRAIALSSALCMAALVAASQLGIARVERAERTSVELAARIAAQDPPCFGAKARGGSGPCENPALANLLVPEPALVAADVVERRDCRQGRGDQLRVCSVGPAAGYSRRLAAIGDSHLAALLPALEAVAQTRHWHIDVAAKNACHWTTSTPRGLSEARIAACRRWKAALNQRLAAEPPYDAILVTHRAGLYLPDAAPGEDQQTTIVRGLIESWRTQAERGTRIIAIRDNPSASRATAACVARHRLRANEYCALDRSLALGVFDPHPAATLALPGAALVDLSELYCDASICPVVIGNVVVYRDDNHITGTFARTLASRLGEELERILR
jgi:peptidoglycan/LPS O-acetylase OafA/YrhL